ncbi:FKBP-type peptidyl-prolyl cis-trans isomerase [Sphingomonas sp. MJ1 (PH-R8)]|uniref:FKBP-type peptidyl-prolyl cis-trans isomerase n=1 Tax=Sphingomonas sp. MJ1 (PH-R8) TaxID=3112950 RepID=UPI003A887BCC
MSVTAVPLQPVKRRYLVWLWIGIALIVAAAAALAWAGTPHSKVTESGLRYEIIEPGTGPAPTDDDVALINYVGKRPDGSVFDQNQQTPMPVRGVVPGFAEALKMMPKGSKYRFWIPPHLGYGAPRPAGAPPLTGEPAELAKITLQFDVELLDFIPEAVLRQQMMQQMMQGGGAGGAMPGGGAPEGSGR